ncbi:MAG: class I SAM-dependent methyltransferase [Actinobacteria bacterium]|nr:class I SAM-dependent methyltransferase [Actinomycetota bacterium]
MPRTESPQRPHHPTSPHPPVETIDSRIGAALYNPFLWFAERRGMAARRRGLLAEARGEVLEIGAGTGLNLPHYPPDLDALVLTEPGERISSHIDLGRGPAGVPTRLERAPAEELPFEDASFDTVVSTLVLCTVSDPERAVAEVARVLRPDGRLLFLEHVRAEPGWRQTMQRRSVGPWAAFADGCQCDRETLGTIEARLRIAKLERATWRGMPAIVKPLVWGHAVAG